jgi:hypothetical protein
VSLPAARHFEPVQFFFHLMKRIVADLVVVAHGENGLACGLNGIAMDVAVRRLFAVASFRM